MNAPAQPRRVRCRQCGALHELSAPADVGVIRCQCGRELVLPPRDAQDRALEPAPVRLRSRLAPPNIAAMTTMADVAFLLIIFFMLTSTFARDTGLDITLPTAITSEQLPKREITIWVNRQGQIKVNEEWVHPRDLVAVLKRELATTSLRAVTIRGDENVPYGTIVTVMDTAKRLGAGITLAAEVEMAGPALPAGRAGPEG